MLKNLLEVKNLNITFTKNEIKHNILSRIFFNVNENEVLAIVGESGSGKSVTASAIMGLLPKNLHSSGQIEFHTKNLTQLSTKAFQSIRGKDITMIFQEPMSALNPSMSCGKQASEILKQHTSLSKAAIKEEILTLFEQVKLPQPKRIYKAYPHEISGGQKQRIMIAMAIACKPKLLIADEPTTALDVSVQKDILDLLKHIQKETRMSMLFISHDLALVSQLANRVIVMYKGSIVEQGDVEQIFKQPKHNYTKSLIYSRPSMTYRLKKLPTSTDFITDKVNSEIVSAKDRAMHHKKLYSQKPLLEVTDLEKVFFTRPCWFCKSTTLKVIDGLSFKVYPGETLGLVGESGCGKSTLGNAILQLDKATSGSIKFKGKPISKLKGRDLRVLRKAIQIIFQDPFASLNPRIQVGNAIIEPMQVHGIGTSYSDRKAKVLDILKNVGLSNSDFNKYPHQFSGGQRQRICIARSIALMPQLIICDESVSALDISVQAQVLNLLNDLKETYGFTYIFISHDLAVVKYMADSLIVMNKGKIEEYGEADSIYNTPKKPYTKALIEAIPKG